MATRAITNSTVRAHCKPLFQQQKIVIDIIEAVMYGNEYFNMIPQTNNTYSYGLRDIPRCRLTKIVKNHTVMALKVSNKLPEHIFALDKLSLKRQVSDWLTHKSFYNINAFFNLMTIEL